MKKIFNTLDAGHWPTNSYHPHLKKPIVVLTLFVFCSLVNVYGQRYMENLGRGTVAVSSSSSQIFVSWRVLGPEFNAGVRYNLYRGATRIATDLNVSNFVDTNSSNSSTYQVAAVVGGIEQAKSAPVNVNTHIQGTNTMACVRVPIRNTAGYAPGLIHVGDLNGDGEYDFIFTKRPADAAQHIFVEAYLNNGTFLWRYDCGPNSVNKNNIEPGSSGLDTGHGDNWTVYDLDNNGRAEVIIRTADGSTFAGGGTVTDSNDNRQFISVLDGMTGRELSRAPVPTDYISDGPMNGHMGIAYLDGVNPSVVWSSKNRIGSGDFNMMVTTYTYTAGTVRLNWKWLRTGNIPDGHNINIIDVDGDGRDEIIPFGFALRPNGTLLWNLGARGVVHGDRFHLGDLDPTRAGIEGYAIQQDNPSGLAWVYYDARTGVILEDQFTPEPRDMARGIAGDFDPRFLGYEFHTFTDGLYNVSGTRTSTAIPSSYPNLRIWWDGDLLSENLDNNKMTKWDHLSQTELRLYNFRSNQQWARNVPGFYGDILGDWREEAVYPADDGNSLLVFTTLNPTSSRIYTLPHNPGYRNCMTTKGYYQSNMVDFYLGQGMTTPPTPNIRIVNSQQDPTTSITIQENTTGFCSLNGTIDTNNPGYTGTGFANTPNAIGTGVNWRVSFAAGGSQTYSFRHANGSASSRTANLLINGTVASTLTFPSTGNWETWTIVSVTINGTSGTKDVRLESTVASGLSNIDYLQVSGATPQALACSGTTSAAARSGASETEVPSNDASLQVFPNPSNSDFVEIRTYLEAKSPVQIQMTNLLGSEVHNEDLGIHEAGAFTHKVKITTLRKGAYLIKLKTMSKQETTKLVIK